MSKKLVAYFSASGTTTAAAKTLAEASVADLYEIRPQTPYTRADLDWMNKKSRSSVEMNDKSFRPPLADKDAHIEGYDTIFLGFPIWWNTMPMVLFTFLEHYNWTGKRIIPFCTNEGSGIGNSVRDIKKICKGADVDNGASFTGSRVRSSEGQVKAWAKSKL